MIHPSYFEDYRADSELTKGFALAIFAYEFRRLKQTNGLKPHWVCGECALARLKFLNRELIHGLWFLK